MPTARYKLADITEIRVGQTFRKGITKDPAGNIHVLQIKDLRASTKKLEAEKLPRTKWQEERLGGVLETGNIVMPGRGEYYEALLIKEEARSNLPIVATNQIFILSPNLELVSAEYLSWYLNRQASQYYFRENITGSSIPMLNKENLGSLEIEVLSAEKQQMIVNLYSLFEKEKDTTLKLIANREQQLEGAVQRLLKT